MSIYFNMFPVLGCASCAVLHSFFYNCELSEVELLNGLFVHKLSNEVSAVLSSKGPGGPEAQSQHEAACAGHQHCCAIGSGSQAKY